MRVSKKMTPTTCKLHLGKSAKGTSADLKACDTCVDRPKCFPDEPAQVPRSLPLTHRLVANAFDALEAAPSVPHTGGDWSVACDSYGKVRHSHKACVYTCIKNERGAERLVTVAARIENWDDAKVMAAAKELLAACKQALSGTVDRKMLSDAIAKAEG